MKWIYKNIYILTVFSPVLLIGFLEQKSGSFLTLQAYYTC